MNLKTTEEQNRYYKLHEGGVMPMGYTCMHSYALDLIQDLEAALKEVDRLRLATTKATNCLLLEYQASLNVEDARYILGQALQSLTSNKEQQEQEEAWMPETYYKVRNKNTGLYLQVGEGFGKKGSQYYNLASLKLLVKAGPELEILEYSYTSRVKYFNKVVGIETTDPPKSWEPKEQQEQEEA